MEKPYKTYHYYFAFGLNICAELEFPELMKSISQEEDLYIAFGEPPEDIQGSEANGLGWQLKSNNHEMLYKDPELGSFYAFMGSRVVVSPVFNSCDWNAFRLVILTTVMTAILLQKGKVCLHAASIIKDNSVTLICGASGAGKSTTLAGLLQKGYQIFSDDVVVVNSNSMASATYPMMKLWENTQTRIKEQRYKDQSFVIKSGHKKYGIFFHSEFFKENCEIGKILCLQKGETKKVEMTELVAFDAFQAISNNIYRPQLINTAEFRLLGFKIVSQLANSCRVYQITRPEQCDPSDLLKLVENVL